MRAVDLDYELPEHLIAQTPLADRDGARLLALPRAGGPGHRRVLDLPDVVPPALWVLNDTRVMPARLAAQRPTGGRVEVLLVERLSAPGTTEEWLCMAKASKPVRPGAELRVADDLRVEVLAVEGRMRRVRLHSAAGVEASLVRHGELPLPPYIRRAPTEVDAARYQTVFAKHPGAVAAPTAGLHLSEALLGRLGDAGHRVAHVTLHVGPGTFAPLRSEELAEHSMHRERYVIPPETASAIAEAKREGRPVLAVGTTVVRTLEAAAAASADGTVTAAEGATDIFIYPPYRFRVVDQLLTNFHLPRSTLLALVMAFAGVDRVAAAYREAVAEGYRFFSYGDAMWLEGVERG